MNVGHLLLLLTSLCIGVAVPAHLCRERVKRVVGGRNAGRGEAPYQVLITNLKTKQVCGGSIVHHSFVLTAKHCAYKGQWKHLMVEAGLVCSTERLGVARRYVSEMHFPNVTNNAPKNSLNHFQGDIALLKLDVPFARSYPWIEPVPLQEDVGYEGEDCIVSGWGSTRVDGESAIRLQLARVHALPRKLCEKKNNHRLSGDLLCAGLLEGGADSCQGDSGGPLVCGGRLTGIVKRGVSCGSPEHPGKYTEVARYATWITSIINNSTHHSKWSTRRNFTF